MKNIILIFVLILPLFAFSETKFDLITCREKAKQNYPKLKQKELLQQISALKTENTKGNYLPSFELNGQATYQSEVISFELPIPGFEFYPVSKDQYKVYLDVKQTIWDGGVTNSLNELEAAGLKTNLQKIEIELSHLSEMVDVYFFSILMVDKSTKVISAQQTVIQNQIERIENALKYGAARDKDIVKLKMESIQLEQKKTELFIKKNTLLNVLAVIIGESIDEDSEFIIPETKQNENILLRPELEFFDLQKKQLLLGDKVLEVSRNPKLFGFGQAGYGKPGFNMLKNEFDPYYIFGVGLSWKITDWSKTKRNIEINAKQREVIQTLQEDFIQKQNLQIAEASANMAGIKKLIETDKLMLEGRKQIAEAAAAELQNGSITSTDYLMDLNAETVAKINFEMHKIQLMQAIVKYNSILGY